MSPDNLAADVEADAQARIGFFFGISDLVEPLKDPVLMLFGNPNAKILHTHADRGVVCCDTNEHGVCVRRILDSVIEKVNEYLPDAVAISKYLGQGVSFKLDVMRLSCFLDVFHDFFY